MNKLFTKIAALALGMTMATGVGVAVASSSKEASPAFAAGGTFSKITSAGDLTSGNKYLIVSETDNLAFDGSLSTIDAVSNTKSVTISSGSITTTSDFYFTITSKSGGYSIKGSGGKYIGSDSANANELKSSTSDSYTNTITWDSDSSCFIIRGTNSYLVYNGTSGQTRYRYYKPTTCNYGKGTGSYHKVSLFKEAATGITVTFNSNGGSESPAAKSITSGGTFTFPSPGTKAGYKFDGWSSDGGTTKYAVGATSPAVTQAITYTAYWSVDAVTSVTLALGTFSKDYYTTDSWDWEHLSVTYGTESGASGTATGLTLSDFSFDPAAPNSTSINSVSVSVEYQGVTSNTLNITGITVSVEPLNDTLTAAIIGQSSYGDWSGKAGTNSDAVYAGNSTKSSNNAIQIRSSNSNSGIVSTTSGGIIKKVSVVWNTTDMANTAKNLDVYAKKTAYTQATDLYDDSKKGTLVGNISYTNSSTYQTELEISGNYTFIGVRSRSNAMYMNSITFEWEESTGPTAPIVEITTGQKYLVDGGSSATFSATITNDNSYTITWSATPSTGVTINPSTSSSGGNVSISFDGTTTGTTPVVIKATLDDTSHTESDPFSVYSLEHAGTAADPFSATDADVFCNTSYASQSGGDWYVQGYVVGEIANNKGYYIDEDATATSAPYKFEVYNNSGIVNQTGKTITVGTSYIVAHGSMLYYSAASQSEIQDSIITSVENGEVPSIGIDGGDRIVDINDSVTLTATVEHAEGATVTWSSSDNSVVSVSGGVLTLNSVGEAEITASITVDNVEYSSTITVTVVRQAFNIGDEVYFYATYNNQTYYMCAVGGTSSSTTTEANKIVFTVVQGSVTGSVAFKHGNDYLKCTSSTPYSGSSTTLDADTSWTAIDEGTKIVITTCGTETGRKLFWNYNNGTPRFGCYKDASATILYVSAGVAAKPTSVTLTEHAVTLENGSSTTLTYTSDNPGVFLWTSSSDSVATVSSDGEVECLTDSGTTTIRIFYDTNGNGVYDAGEPTDTCVITAIPGQIHFGDANYGGIGTLIESDSSGTSLNGKKIIFGCAAHEVISGALSGQFIDSHDSEETEFTVSYDSTNHQFTVGNGLADTGVSIYTLHSISSGKYSISTVVNGATKYLSETAVKKLAYSDSPYSWDISIASGVATIQSTNGYLKYNSGSPRFTTYASGQAAIEIYEYYSYYDEATSYAEIFVGGTTGTCSETISDWDTLGELFDDLTTGAKNIYRIATHEDPSSYSHELTVEHAAARYDDAVRKHVELQDNEFMHRFGEGSVNGQLAPKENVLSIISSSSNTITIIVIVSIISTSAIGGYFFIRKRKEN